MTFGEYKASGKKYDRKVWANDTKGGFGNKGGTIYGYSPAMENWEIDHVSTEVTGVVDGKPVFITTLHIIFPY